MAMVQTAFRTRPTSYRHSTVAASWSQRAEMPLFQAFLRPSSVEVTDGLCIKDATTIDPCMGSGHILVYAFDVLMQIYESYGYSQRDAAKSIVKNNIYGLDIDDRAFQLAYFAIMMKARSYNRRFLTLGIEPNLCAIQESNGLQYEKDMGDFLLSDEHRETLQYLLHTFVDAKEYGSILTVEKRDYDGFLRAWEQTAEQTVSNVVTLVWYDEWNQIVPVLARQAKILSQKYDIAVTNPPYMGISNGNVKLNEFVKKNYPDSKSDLFAVFIEKCMGMLEKNGFQAMITQHSWMFLSSFEKLREKILLIDSINMVHLGARAFEEISGEVVQTTAFVRRNSRIKEYISKSCRLVLQTTQKGKENAFLAGKNCFSAKQCNFLKIPGIPIAYWVSTHFMDSFEKYPKLEEFVECAAGISTGDNEKYLKLWFEVEFDSIAKGINSEDEFQDSQYKYAFCNKGGSYRKWYGNNDYIAYWKKSEEFHRNGATYKHLLFREGITWNEICLGNFNSRYYSNGYIFDHKSPGMFPRSKEDLKAYLGMLNSKVISYFLSVINPTISTGADSLRKIPVANFQERRKEIKEIVDNCISISEEDWDSFETSWDFVKHPLTDSASFSMKKIQKDKKNHIIDMNYIEEAYKKWENKCFLLFNQLKSNEEKLNHIFIDIYGLQDELKPEIEDKDVTVRKADLGRDIRSFISYAVGCMFGRYSLDQEGLMFAGGDMKDIYAYYGGTFADTANIQLDGKYTFGELGTPFYYLPVDGKEPLECWKVDADNIIPITDEEYFTDDIVGRFIEFVKTVYGKETLEGNLDFIAQALGNKGDSSREIIRNYFMKDFYADHLKVYQKRPIYWLFDSGKQNGFKALIYMHRYNADTIGNLRVDYLHRMERIYESEINRMQDTIDNSSNAREVTVASKRKEKLQKQLKECQEYDEKIGHLALSRIEIDLDDGVKVNYEKVQTARDGKKYQVLAKI